MNKSDNRSYEDDSRDSLSSVDSVSSRKSERNSMKKIPGVIFFYSDESTWVEKDLIKITNKVPVKDEDCIIKWNNNDEKIKIVKVGDSLADCSEAQALFEKLMTAGIALSESVQLCENEKSASIALKRMKREVRKIGKENKKTDKAIISKGPSRSDIIDATNLPPLFAENDSVLEEAHGQSSRPDKVVDVTYNENSRPVAVLNIAPPVTQSIDMLLDVMNIRNSRLVNAIDTTASQPSSTVASTSEVGRDEPPALTSAENADVNVKKLMAEITAADSAVERGNICLHYATIFHQKIDKEIQLMPGYNIFVGKNARKLALKDCKNNPEKLQRLLLKAIKGDEYISKHSALGQKKDTGFPAVEKDLLEAVDLFVKSKLPDAEPQCINKTFNELASNLRVKQKRREGKLQQSKKKPKKNG